MNRLLKTMGVPALAASTMVGSAVAESSAQGYPMAKNKSAHFSAVASQLEMGGLSFSYDDTGSKIELTKTLVAELVKYLDNNTPVKGIDAAALVDLLALDSVKAIGSSASQRDGFVHYRAFQYMPEKKSALSKIYADSEPSVAAQLAPAGADLVLELHVNGSQSPELEKKLIAAMGPMGTMVQSQMQEALEQDPTTMVVKNFLENMNSRVSFIGDLSPEGIEPLKGSPVSGEFLVSMTNAEEAWKLMRASMEASSEEIVVDGDVEYTISPEEIIGWKPILRYDKKTKQLLGATSKEYLDKCLSAAAGKTPSLLKDPEFVKINEGLPESYSVMAYVSPQFAKTALQLSLFAVPQIEDEQVRPAVIQLINLLRESDMTKTGTIYAATVGDNGTLQIVNSPVDLPRGAGDSPTTVAVTLSSVSTLFVGAKYYKENADKAACIINLTNMHKATRAMQNIENIDTGAPLTWELLVGEGRPLQTKPSCPSGGIYTLSSTMPKTGKPAVECSCEGHAPESTEGW